VAPPDAEYGADMAVSVPYEGAAHSLPSLLRQAGAVFARRGGHETAIHYGSPAGELAVCVRAVGLVDRSDLTKLMVEAPAAQLRQLIHRLTGTTVAPGGALLAGGAWWCAATPQQLYVLCERPLGDRLQRSLQAQALRHVEVSDRSQSLAAFGVLGRGTTDVLRALGALGECGDPRLVRPFSERVLAAGPARVLLESDRQALLLVAEDRAGELWLAIERAGRSFGLSCVGLEAARRYALIERARTPTAPHA
jgi:glycine cleavage system aminomethyltransferase T